MHTLMIFHFHRIITDFGLHVIIGRKIKLINRGKHRIITDLGLHVIIGQNFAHKSGTSSIPFGQVSRTDALRTNPLHYYSIE